MLSEETDVHVSDRTIELENILASDVHMTWSLAWWLPLSAGLLLSAPSVRSDPEHFAVTTSGLSVGHQNGLKFESEIC